jgi:hypothetical protein
VYIMKLMELPPPRMLAQLSREKGQREKEGGRKIDDERDEGLATAKVRRLHGVLVEGGLVVLGNALHVLLKRGRTRKEESGERSASFRRRKKGE